MAIKREPPVRKCARPITLVHEPKATKAILCLHGYSGYPGELALPAKRLFEAGFDVYVPRYPGHGTDGEDFLSTGANDWIGKAESMLRELNGQYAQVSLVGHSMGGAIAVILAKRYAIKSLVLYAPALLIPALSHGLISMLSLFVKKRPQVWNRDPRYGFFDERDPDDDLYLGSQYWSWLYPRQLRQLSLIRREAEQALAETTADILVLTGENDTTVSQDVGILVIEKGLGNNNWVHMPKATHLIPYDIDTATREEAMERTVSWLSL